VGFIGKVSFRPSLTPSFLALYRRAKQVFCALITCFFANSYSNWLPPFSHFGIMGKGGKKEKHMQKPPERLQLYLQRVAAVPI
jgi:hypothetical protein